MFLHIPQVLSHSQLTSVERTLGHVDAPWVDGIVTAGHQGAAVKRNQQLQESSQASKELGDLILTVLERNALFVSATLPHRVYPVMFNRYCEGMQFGDHVDGSIRILPTGQRLRTDLSATVFLSPPASYEGGELVVENDCTNQTIKLEAGDMVIYSAASRHRVNPVTRGARLAAVFWVQSLVRGDFERLQLFELDRTIQNLTKQNADAQSLLRLTAHYHSLLRLWSDT